MFIRHYGAAASVAALTLGLGLPGAALGQAQGPQPFASTGEPVEEILVTGTRLPRRHDDSAPITALSGEEIRVSGHVTLEDVLEDLPSVTGGNLGAGINNGSQGLATISQRGLGPIRTLVLVDGQRQASYGVDNVVDLNLIPLAMIERVEVFRDAASSVYGSDAIGGVVNLITRKDFEGVELDAQFDISDEGDGEIYNVSALFGRNHARGNFTAGAQFVKRKPIWQDERDFSACGLIDFGDEPFCDDSIFSYPPLFNPWIDEDLYLIVDPVTDEVRDHSFMAPDAYNFAPASYLVTPQEVFSLFGTADYELLGDGGFSSVTARVRAHWSQRDADQQLAPDATFWTPLVPASNPFNPFGDLLCADNAAAGCSQPQDVLLARRLVETGGRRFEQDVESWQVSAGLDGVLTNGWRWDLTYSHAELDGDDTWTGRARIARFDTLLDPALCAADPACPGVWDPFRTGTLTPDLLAYATATPVERVDSELKVIQANLQGDTGAIRLPGGAIEWALGLERRSEDARFVADPTVPADEDDIFGFTAGSAGGDYDVNEAYGELRLPLVAGARFAEELSLDGALRWSDYDFLSGSETTARLGLNWAPVRDLRFRASWAEGFRAPSIGERFDPEQLTFDMYSDPCIFGQDDPVVAANCASEGFAPGAGGLQGQVASLTRGSEALEPETSENWTLGAVFSPAAMPDFVVSVDWFNIEIDDAIGQPGAANVINACYASPDFSSPLCALILGPDAVGDTPNADPNRPFRNAFDDISGVDLGLANRQLFETTGVDFEVRYGLDVAPGRLDLRLWGTWLDEFRFQTAAGTPVLDFAGRFGADPYLGKPAAFPEWRTNLSAGLLRDAWSVRWTARYLSSVEDLEPAGKYAPSAGSRVYHDLQGQYVFDAVTLTAGVRNLFDRDPPYVTAYDDMNTLPATYDTAGRYYWLRATLRF